MTKEKEVVRTAVELIDPKEFVPHPLKSELQLPMDKKPLKAKAAMDNAFEQIPEQVIPVMYTLCEIDGVIKKAIIDGMGRVYKAIENNVAFIPAIKIEIDSTNAKEVFKKILAPNHTFHTSLLEIGKAASRLHKEFSVGQGKRPEPGKKQEDPDDVIAGLLGYGLRSSRVKKARLVYESNPNLLRMVDAGELKSLAAAYATTKKTRPITVDSYADGEESVIIGSDTEGVIAQNNHSAVIPSPLNEERIVAEEKITPVMEVTVKHPLIGQPFTIQCPCCKEQIIITTI